MEAHREELRTLKSALRALRPALRANAEAQSERERAALLRNSGVDGAKTPEKGTALREAERGTAALREAARMMRQVRMQRMFGKCFH